jgi:hypothetical protein
MCLNKKQVMYIGCIPVWASPTHPTDQSPCTVRNCPLCDQPMWVSEKKKALELLYPKLKTYCLHCLAIHANEEKLVVELRDIAKGEQ